MHYRLDLVLRTAEGALLRVLGLTERRGFATIAIEGAQHPDPERTQWRIALTVHGERAPESLKHQIEKLHDCLSIEITPCPSP